MDIQHALKGLRTWRGIGTNKLGDVAGISASYISLLERGKRGNSTLDSLEILSATLGLPITLFIFLAELDSLRQSDPELVAAILTAKPELKELIDHMQLVKDGLIEVTL